MGRSYKEFGFPRLPALAMITPDAKCTWSAAMIRAAMADALDFIDEMPVRFMVIEKAKEYSTRLLVQFMVRHYRFENSRMYNILLNNGCKRVCTVGNLPNDRNTLMSMHNLLRHVIKH